MNWRDIWTLYRVETRAAMRERAIVVNSILIPILLYPAIIFVMISGLAFVGLRTEAMEARIALRGAAEVPAAGDFVERLEEHERIELVELADDGRFADAEQLERRQLDAVVEIEPDPAGLDGNYRVRLIADGARESSVTARDRVLSILEESRSALLERLAVRHGVDPTAWLPYEVVEDNRASGEQMGAFLLGLMLPVMFIIMVAIGSFYPAVDATAGERERSTWETTLTLATLRANVVVAKYLYVATFGCLAGFLNVAAMTLSMRSLIGGLLADAGESLEFAVPLSSLPVLALAAVLLAAFIAAGMMIFAAFARNFREGQSMVTPFYLVILLPVFFLNDPGLRLDPRLALVPIVNVGLMVRDAIAARSDAGLILLTTVASLLLVAAALWLATRILAYEDVVTGSFGGSFGRFLKQRLLRRAPATPSPPSLPD